MTADAAMLCVCPNSCRKEKVPFFFFSETRSISSEMLLIAISLIKCQKSILNNS